VSPGDRVVWERLDGHEVVGTISHEFVDPNAKYVVSCETKRGPVEVLLPSHLLKKVAA
jgi:hypothetical protein